MTYRLRNIGIAIVLAVVAALLTTFYVTNYKRSVQHSEGNVPVYVATHDIEIGTSGADVAQGGGLRVEQVPRRSVVLASLALAVVVSVTGALVGDWVKLRELTREAVTFQDQITRQRATIEAFNRRVGELRQEMAGWRDIHARIWEPFGPELARTKADRGIGGGTTHRPGSTATKLLTHGGVPVLAVPARG